MDLDPSKIYSASTPRRITFCAFNYGLAGKVVNGPGITLVNFVSFLQKHLPSVKIDIFVADSQKNSSTLSLKDFYRLQKSIELADVVHCWSGLSPEFTRAIKYANKFGVKVIIGPNTIDTVELERETNFLIDLVFHKLLTVNERLRFRIAQQHQIELSKIELLKVGPDLALWAPIPEDNGKILWKGNAKHFVKDVSFGLEVAKQLPQYQFDFLGYQKPYEYHSHIAEAKQYHLYFSTSLSETMGLTILEQMAASIPVITHPKIYLHGINYQTGIITNRDVDSYCQAIVEVMENNKLHSEMKIGARRFMEENFSSEKIVSRYLEILQDK